MRRNGVQFRLGIQFEPISMLPLSRQAPLSLEGGRISAELSAPSDEWDTEVAVVVLLLLLLRRARTTNVPYLPKLSTCST